MRDKLNEGLNNQGAYLVGTYKFKKGIDNLSLSYLVLKLDTIFQWKFICLGISVDSISQKIWIKRVR